MPPAVVRRPTEKKKCSLCHGLHHKSQDACLQKYLSNFKCKPDRKEAQQTLVGTPSLPKSNPVSPSLRTAQEFVHVLGQTYWTESWPRLVPSRMNYSRSINLAAKACIQAQVYTNDKSSMAKAECLQQEALAIDAVRGDLHTGDVSDEVLLAIALLGLFEILIEPFGTTMYSHMNGRSAVIKARPPGGDVGEITQAILYTHWYSAFMPSICGSESGLESPKYIDMEPAGHRALRPAVCKLKKAGFQLAVRLPRLVMLLREVNSGASQDLASAMELAKELLDLRNVEAENDFLHLVGVVETAHFADLQMAPYSFDFPELAAQEAAMSYWAGCIFLARLCLRLHEMDPQWYDIDVGVDIPRLKDEAASMARNILMSLQYTLATGSFGICCLPMVSTALWGAAEDFDAIPSKPLGEVHEWIVRRCCDALGVQCKSYEPLIEFFADVAEQSAGGPIPVRKTEGESTGHPAAWSWFLRIVKEQQYE